MSDDLALTDRRLLYVIGPNDLSIAVEANYLTKEEARLIFWHQFPALKEAGLLPPEPS